VQGEIVILGDARQRFSTRAIRALVEPFANSAVGAVGGDLVLLESIEDASEICRGIGAYWRYEKFIRSGESQLDSTVGASGAIYAIRRNLFKEIPDDIILDDVLIPMQIVRQGYRVVFQPAARACDRVSPTAETEFGRKVRTIAGNFQLFWKAPWLLSPRLNRIWWQTISHKAFRLIAPPCLAIAFITSIVMLHRPFYSTMLAFQILFYCSALIGFSCRKSHIKPMLVNIPYTFCLLNWATVVAFWRFVRGRQGVTWKITHVR
jgi:GT2 family glycosyltransferase